MKITTEFMTPYEFMVKPLIDAALERKDFEYLNKIKNGDIFNGVERVSVLFPIKDLDLETDLTQKATAPIQKPIVSSCGSGNCCKLYKNCITCGKEKYYKDFMYGNLDIWRKNRVCLKCHSGQRNLTDLEKYEDTRNAISNAMEQARKEMRDKDNKK